VDERNSGLEVRAVAGPFIAYPGIAEIIARVEQTLSRRVPACGLGRKASCEHGL